MSKEAFTVRQMVGPYIVKEGPQINYKILSPRINSSFGILPFDLISMEPIAVKKPGEIRDVAILKATIVSKNTIPVVIKIGCTRNDSVHLKPIERAKDELKWSSFFQETPLGKYCVPTYPIVCGKNKENQYDLRIQTRFVQGKTLQTLPLFWLTQKEYESLLRFHDDYVKTLFIYNRVPEPGYTLDKYKKPSRLFQRLVKYSPFSSSNILLDDKTQDIVIVDTGFPSYGVYVGQRGVKKYLKRFVLRCMLQGERMMLVFLNARAKALHR